MDAPKVLVIEDEEDTNELICKVLTGAGYHATAAKNGADGIEKAKESAPDLILLDITMPEMDGLDVCRALKDCDETRAIPVIMVTARRDFSAKIKSYITGARHYIVKPFEPEVLLGEVERALGR